MSITESWLINSPRIPMEQAVMSPAMEGLVTTCIVLGLFFLAAVIPIIIVECMFPSTPQEELDKRAKFDVLLAENAQEHRQYVKNLLTTTVNKLKSNFK